MTDEDHAEPGHRMRPSVRGTGPATDVGLNAHRLSSSEIEPGPLGEKKKHDVEEAIGLADRMFLLSASNARLLADAPVDRPRTKRTAEELAALRKEIACRLSNQPS